MELKNKYNKQNYYHSHLDSFMKIRKAYQFSILLKVDPFRFNYHLNKPIYFTFQIPKKNYGYRKIASPNEELKNIQKELNRYLQEMYIQFKPKSVHGFIINPPNYSKQYGIVSNAKAHVGKKHILNLDLKDFFSSISAKQVKNALMNRPFALNEEPATIVALLGTFNKVLPTGAPTSPALSNIVCYTMDKDFETFANSHNLIYTRYADDLCFSSDIIIRKETIEEIKNTIRRFGFIINPKKERLISYKAKQTVTGLIVNKKANVDRKYIRQLRAILHSLETTGTELAAARHFKSTDLSQVDIQKFIRKIAGQIEFVGYVRGKEDVLYRKLLLSFEQNIHIS